MWLKGVEVAEIGQSSGCRATGPRQGAKTERKPAAQDGLPHLKSNQHGAAPGRVSPSVGLRGTSRRPVAPAWGPGITTAAPTCSKHLTTSSVCRIKDVSHTHTHIHTHSFYRFFSITDYYKILSRVSLMLYCRFLFILYLAMCIC